MRETKKKSDKLQETLRGVVQAKKGKSSSEYQCIGITNEGNRCSKSPNCSNLKAYYAKVSGAHPNIIKLKETSTQISPEELNSILNENAALISEVDFNDLKKEHVSQMENFRCHQILSSKPLLRSYHEKKEQNDI